MEDDQNGAVVTLPPSSDTRGIIVNQTLLPPPVAAATIVHEASAHPAPPYGVHLNNNNNPIFKEQQQQQQLQQHKSTSNTDHRTRRPRRGKRKRSKKIMPYTKDRMFRYKAVAPNNTNQFLMDDHNDGPDIDKKLSARYNNEIGRTRNSSFTSIESDGDHIYSSSDDEGSSIQKEFIDTYRLVQEEQLAGLNHEELTQRVIELEEKVQMLESKRYRKNIMTYVNDLTKEVVGEEDSIDPEEYRLMQIQIRELTTQNKKLQTEVETLKQVQARNSNNSNSSVDSESSSDSSDSSSSSSEGQEIEMKFLLRSERKDGESYDNTLKDN